MFFPKCILANYSASSILNTNDKKAFIANTESFIKDSKALVASVITAVENKLRYYYSDSCGRCGEATIVCDFIMEDAERIQKSLNELESSFKKAQESGKFNHSYDGYEEKHFKHMCSLIQVSIEELFIFIENNQDTVYLF